MYWNLFMCSRFLTRHDWRWTILRALIDCSYTRISTSSSTIRLFHLVSITLLFLIQAFHTQWSVQLRNCKWKLWSGRTKICGLCIKYTCGGQIYKKMYMLQSRFVGVQYFWISMFFLEMLFKRFWCCILHSTKMAGKLAGISVCLPNMPQQISWNIQNC